MIQYVYIIFFKQKTAYEMRIRDWSSDVCSADLDRAPPAARHTDLPGSRGAEERRPRRGDLRRLATDVLLAARRRLLPRLARRGLRPRSEEHTSDLQSLMRISYAVFCLTKTHISVSDIPSSPSTRHVLQTG